MKDTTASMKNKVFGAIMVAALVLGLGVLPLAGCGTQKSSSGKPAATQTQKKDTSTADKSSTSKSTTDKAATDKGSASKTSTDKGSASKSSTDKGSASSKTSSSGAAKSKGGTAA